MPWQPVSVEILLTSLTHRQHERCRNMPNGRCIRHCVQHIYCCVWIPWSSYSTVLYTAGLSYEHRHNVVKFFNVSGTSTTDTVQKGRLNRSWLIIENGKYCFLLMLLANVKRGWYLAVRHNLTGSGWFYEHRNSVIQFSNLSRISTTDKVQATWLFWP